LQHQISLLAAELCLEGMQVALKQGTDSLLKHSMFSDSELHRPWLGADVLVDSQGGVHSNLNSYSAQHSSAASMQTRPD